MSRFYSMFFIFVFSFIAQLNLSYAILTPLDPEQIHEAFVTKYSEATLPIVTGKEPPAAILEKQPPQPSPETIWIPGYWAWDDAKTGFIWICGIWRIPPPNHGWISGSWVKNLGGWSWARGFWSPIPEEKLTLIQTAPPVSIADKLPPSPGDNYFWVPGNWNYSINTNQYAWFSGKWTELNEKWVLSPSCYIWRPTGYYFVPLYWDWTLDKRGAAYSCSKTDGTLPMLLLPEVIVKELFLCYPDYITLYCHWGYYHPEWWDGCWCLPPWWQWNSWWTLPWTDAWGLWWWWGHPGFFPPWWMTIEMSMELYPPPLEMVEYFKKMSSKPHFQIKKTEKPFLPQGKLGGKEIPLPLIPSDVTPIGQVVIPSYPNVFGGGETTVPSLPDVVPLQEPIPSSSQYSEPAYTQPYNPNYQPTPILTPDYIPTYPVYQPVEPIYPIHPIHPDYPIHPGHLPNPSSNYQPTYPSHEPIEPIHPNYPNHPDYPRDSDHLPNQNSSHTNYHPRDLTYIDRTPNYDVPNRNPNINVNPNINRNNPNINVNPNFRPRAVRGPY